MEILMVILTWLATMLVTYALGYVRGEREAKAESIHWHDIQAAFRGVNLRREVFFCSDQRIETQDGCFMWVRGVELDKVTAKLDALQERRKP